jgi:hypothetical protein
LIADELQQIHRWLSAPDPSSNHNDACKMRQPTTGTWFINGEVFKRWKSDLNSFIWLYGIRTFPGDIFTAVSDRSKQLVLVNQYYGK